MAEESPDEIAQIITKYLEDDQTITEHSSRNYTGKALVYATKDRYEGDFKDGLRKGVGTYTYFKEEPQNKYEGEWVQNKKHDHVLLHISKNLNIHYHFLIFKNTFTMSFTIFKSTPPYIIFPIPW